MSGVQGPGGPSNISQYGSTPEPSAPVSMDQVKQVTDLFMQYEDSPAWAEKARALAESFANSPNQEVAGSANEALADIQSYEASTTALPADRASGGPDSAHIHNSNTQSSFTPLTALLIPFAQILQHSPGEPISGDNRFQLIVCMKAGQTADGRSVSDYLHSIHPTTDSGRAALAQAMSALSQDSDTLSSAIANLIITE